MDRYAKTIEWQSDETVVSWLPLYHDMGLVTSFLLPAVHGGTIVTMDPFSG